MNVAVIPARGGSKRIPRKNVKHFGGRPMIAWTIEAAIASGCFDRVIVSTDDEEIAEVASNWGAEIPFVRPADLAGDFVGTMPVMAHAVEQLSSSRPAPDMVCCLYATAPFLSADDIRLGLRVLQNSSASYAFSVTTYAFPIQRALRVTSDGRLEMFNPDMFEKRSQDLEEAWHDAGQFYWGRAEAWLAETPIFDHHSIPVKLPRHRVQDIDTPEDWLRAELMHKSILLQEADNRSAL